MKWYSIKTHNAPQQTVCLVFTESNYYHLANAWDPTSPSVWLCPVDHHPIHGVTHFCIPDPVEIEQENKGTVVHLVPSRPLIPAF